MIPEHERMEQEQQVNEIRVVQGEKQNALSKHRHSQRRVRERAHLNEAYDKRERLRIVERLDDGALEDVPNIRARLKNGRVRHEDRLQNVENEFRGRAANGQELDRMIDSDARKVVEKKKKNEVERATKAVKQWTEFVVAELRERWRRCF